MFEVFKYVVAVILIGVWVAGMGWIGRFFILSLRDPDFYDPCFFSDESPPPLQWRRETYASENERRMIAELERQFRADRGCRLSHHRKSSDFPDS